MQTYTELIVRYRKALVEATRRFNLIALARLVLVISFLAFGYNWLVNYNPIFLGLMLLPIVIFILLLRLHERLRMEKELNAALVEVNEEELDYLNEKNLPFNDGIEFSDPHHSYTHDIDIFGAKSLFQNLNRCGTFPGRAKLAEKLKKQYPIQEITRNQEAVRELTGKLDFRQKMLAIAKVHRDSKELYQNLKNWCNVKDKSMPKVVSILAFLVPIIFLTVLASYIFTGWGSLGNLSTCLFLINLSVLASQRKLIMQQILRSGRVQRIILQYGLIIKAIEEEQFESAKLRDLQQKLNAPEGLVSRQLQRLASLMNSLEAIQNLLGTVIFNGVFLYHLHVLRGLLNWKTNHAKALEKWLDVIAEFEALSSLSNFSYNNPHYAFPSLNKDYTIEFEELGHPLLDANIRVNNDVSFSENPFILLTGSNMSGKSTFLRALGVNMVLAGIGSVVCARAARVHPLPIYVSMRLSDSLSDSESYFYAEIKRLHEIIEFLKGQRAFILLDEILRGTNSDDKRGGTIEVVKKMVEKQAIGAIATHDLEVCNTTDNYPNYLINKCFEVAIIDDNLHFDYKLHNGVSQNKSATFLMKKMGVI